MDKGKSKEPLTTDRSAEESLAGGMRILASLIAQDILKERVKKLIIVPRPDASAAYMSDKET